MRSPILIVGLPGVGKTTLIRSLAGGYGLSNCAGFFTQERRAGGRRTGFSWETFEGKNGILADLTQGQPRVGRYRVVLHSFEDMLTTIPAPTHEKLLLIDEVGKMECLSEKFRILLPAWEHCNCPRVFTVPTYGTPFIEEFKRRNRTHLVLLTSQNREDS